MRVLCTLLAAASIAIGNDGASLKEKLGKIEFEPGPELQELTAQGADLVPDLLAIVRGDDTALRLKAMFVLGELRPREASAVTALNAVLRTGYDWERYVAATAMAKIAPEQRSYLPWLLRAAKYAQPQRARTDAARTIDAIRSRVSLQLLEALDHGNAGVRLQAFIYLSNGEASDLKELLPRLRAGLKGSRPAADSCAILCAQVAPDTPGLVPILRMALRASESRYADAAVHALRRVDAKDHETVRALVASLEGPSPHVRCLVCTLLGDWGELPDEVVPALVDVIRTDDPSAREYAAFALLKYRAATKPVVAALCGALHEEYTFRKHGSVRHRRGRDWAAIVLGRLRAKEAVPDLIRALEYDGSGVWRSAVVALGAIGPDAAAAVPALISTVGYGAAQKAQGSKAANDERALARYGEYIDGEVREVAVVALGQIGPKAEAAVPLLTRLAATGDKEAQAALKLIRSPR